MCLYASSMTGGRANLSLQICNDCYNDITKEKEDKTISCPCGITYHARNHYYKERHLLSKCHRGYEEKLINKANFDMMKLNELQELNKVHNLNIPNYQKIGKKQLALEIKKLYDEGRFTL